MNLPEHYPARALAQAHLAGSGEAPAAPSGAGGKSALTPPPADYDPNISLCMIAKGDEPGLRDAVSSVYPYVSEVIIALNGTPKMATKARALFSKHPKVRTYRMKWEDDFAAARNFSFSKASGKWLFWIDSDDWVENPENLPALCYMAERKGYGCIQLPYIFRTNERGQPEVVHNRERLMLAELGWTWFDRVHEYPHASKQHMVGSANDVVIKHEPVGFHTERNLQLLKMMEEENPYYPRMLVGQGDCYFSMGNFEQALNYYARYFEVAENQVRTWVGAVNAAKAAWKMEDWPEVMRWAQTAILVDPQFQDPYIMMAHAAWWQDRDAAKVLTWLEMADGKLEAPMEVMREPQMYTINRWDVEHRAWADLGRYDMAQEIVAKGCFYTNYDPKWNYYGYLYLEAQNCNLSVAAAAQIADHLCRRGDTLRAQKFLEECVPLTIKQDKRYLQVLNRVRSFTAHLNSEEAYKAFYEENHEGGDDLNAIDVNLYRMEALDRAFKERGVKRVLDVGCGAGEPTLWLANKGYLVTGIDINSGAIEDANTRAAKAVEEGFIKPNRATFMEGSLDTLGPKELGKFDAVVIMEVVEHVPPHTLPWMFGCATDLLKDGGAVYVTTPNMLVGDIPGLWEEFPRDHVTEFSYADLQNLVLFPPGKNRIWNLHKISEPAAAVPGFGSWFLEFDKNTDTEAKPVVIYVGPGLENWNPRSAEEDGLGGSETWAIETAKAMRKQGYPVIVYAEAEGVWDGVIYRHHSKWEPQASALGVPPWLLIISRFIEVLDSNPVAENVYFMAHDVDYGEAMTQERIDKLDAYLVLSEWHKQHTLVVQPLLADKIRLTANGVHVEWFGYGKGKNSPPRKAERRPWSFIWGSSPDRGLDYLLEHIWPKVIEAHPEATLDVYYGWENIDRMMPSRPWLRQFKAKVLELAQQPGVTWKGRIGQRALAEEYQKHEFWVYPSVTPFGTEWNETFCIAALEAQLAGLNCFVPRRGALPERAISTEYSVVNPEKEFSDVVLAYLDGYRQPGVIVPATDLTWDAVTQNLLAMVESEHADHA